MSSEKVELSEVEIQKLKKFLQDKKGFTPNEVVCCVKFNDGTAAVSKFPSEAHVRALEAQGILKIIGPIEKMGGE